MVTKVFAYRFLRPLYTMEMVVLVGLGINLGNWASIGHH